MNSMSASFDSFARDRLPPQGQQPHFLFERPEYQFPEALNAVEALLEKASDPEQGARIAIIERAPDRPRRAVTYAELARMVRQASAVLTQELKLAPGARVLLRGPNNLMMAVAWLAVVRAGLIAVATMPLLRARELKPVVDKAQVSAALCDVRLADEVRALMDPAHEQHCPTLQTVLWFNSDAPDSLDQRLLRQPDNLPAVVTHRDDVALIAFTSGTTGEPKGCLHFHRDVMAMCEAFPRHVLRPNKTDIFCGTPPLAFTFGLGGLLTFPLHAGAATLLSERLTPETLLKTIAEERASICFTAPTFYRQMAPLCSQFDLASLKKTVSAGEALPDATRTLWREHSGIEMIDGIGATEMIHIFISSPPESVRPGAIGQVVPGYEAMIVDENFQPVPDGTVGRLAVRGPTGCRYLADPRQAKYVQNGWNLPGDTFWRDADGYYFYQARSDDMIVSAGYNIAGPEVEACLLQHPAVAECGVVGVADADRGQIVKAFVVLKEGFEPGPEMVKLLQDYVKETIAPYKYPRAIEFVAALPRTETGKLQRFKLRQSSSKHP